MSTPGLILIVLALAGFGALLVGTILLVWYFRYNRDGDWYEEPDAPGLVRCPQCGYTNPANAAACLNCRLPLQQYGAPPPAPAPAPIPPAPAPQVIRVGGDPPPAPQSATPPRCGGPGCPRRRSRRPVAHMPPGMPRVAGAGGDAGQRARLFQPMPVGRSSVCDVKLTRKVAVLHDPLCGGRLLPPGSDSARARGSTASALRSA